MKCNYSNGEVNSALCCSNGVEIILAIRKDFICGRNDGTTTVVRAKARARFICARAKDKCLMD